MNHLHSLILSIILLAGSAFVATAQNFDKGVAAYNAGDYRTALREWRHFAERGDSDAQYNLGQMYRQGEGVSKDYAEAARWYRLSAVQGDSDAQFVLGAMFQVGHGVLQTNIMAHMWYNIASANGNSQAGEFRDERAGQMSQAEISEAQEMARECMSSYYQNCG